MKLKKSIALIALLASAGLAQAEIGYQGIGARAGFRFGGPDQVVGGLHANLGELTDGLRLQPMVDIGFGDHLTLITINPDLLYFLDGVALGEGMDFYVGGGLAIVYAKLDLDDSGCNLLPEPFRSGCEDAFEASTTDVGLNLICGVEKEVGNGNGLMGEFRVTIEDGTFFQVTGGYIF